MNNGSPHTRHAALELDPTVLAALASPKLHEASKVLLSALDARTRRILEGRFGLTGNASLTLQEIGGLEKITRERVRQLQHSALNFLHSMPQHSPGAGGLKEPPKDFFSVSAVRSALSATLETLGRVAREETLVVSLGLSGEKDLSVLRFLLTVLPGVTEARETQRTYRHWTLSNVVKNLGNDPGPEPPSVERVLEVAEGVLGAARKIIPEKPFLADVRKELGVPVTDTALKSLLFTAKRISRTVFGDWGLRAWREVTPRGVGDKAYNVLKRAREPLHFRTITDAINDAGFDARRAHPQTVHNELIRDSRFVLVGRGFYGLKEWGHEPGTVAEVAMRLLARAGRPVPKQDLIQGVLKERLVKRNTVVLALQNKRLFRALGDGTYVLTVPDDLSRTMEENPQNIAEPFPHS